MTQPFDYDSLVSWFAESAVINLSGGKTRTHEPFLRREDAVRLANMIGRPSPYGPWDNREPWTVRSIFNSAIEYNLFSPKSKYGWIDREGHFWGCGFAAHELLLTFLDLDSPRVELGGWTRISLSGPQCMYEISDEQLRTLIALDMQREARMLLLDNESLKPKRSDVIAARVRPVEE